MIAPSLQTEGKQLQSSQGVGMGSRGVAASVNPPAASEPGGNGGNGAAGHDAEHGVETADKAPALLQ
jgi:IMP dehydrogenase